MAEYRLPIALLYSASDIGGAFSGRQSGAGREELQRFVRSEIARWAKIIGQIGIARSQ